VEREDEEEVLAECSKEEECPKEPEENKSNVYNISHLRKFSEFLVSALNMLPNMHDIWFKKWFKVEMEDRKSISMTVPLYKRDETCYLVNQWLEKFTKLGKATLFDDQELELPDYKQVEIDRHTYKTVLSHSYVFFTYDNKPFIAWLNYECRSADFTIHFRKEDEGQAVKILDDIRRYLRTFSFYKNKRVKLVNGYFFQFLEYPKLGWKDIILTDDIKDEIMLNIVFPLANEKLCKKYKVPWRRGVLLGGEPGTGKTKLAKIMCNLLTGCTIIWVTAESITESNHVKMLFDAARELAPTLIVMEDLDFFGRDRSIERSPIVGELLNQLDGHAPNDGIFVMASSNRPGLLDKALANRPGRFDIKLEVKIPNPECRIRMIKLFSKNKKFAPGVALGNLIGQTDGLTGAHIQEIFVYAALDSLHKGSPDITMKSLEKAVRRLRDKPKSEMIA